MSASGPSESSSSVSTTTVSDSYNETKNFAYNLSDVGNSSFALHFNSPNAPEIGTVLPIAVGALLIGVLFLFKR